MTKAPKIAELSIVEGIKHVGVGQKGSKPLPQALIEPILKEIKSKQPTPAQLGAFFAGIVLKGIEPDEMPLDKAFSEPTLQNPSKLTDTLVEKHLPSRIKAMATSLLQGNALSYMEALSLGRIIFSETPCDGLRGLVASALRVRYESDDEYQGLLKAIEESRHPIFENEKPLGPKLIQMAEPFDGMNKGYLITPLLAKHLVQRGYRVVTLIGENAGPKYDLCLKDLVKALGLKEIHEPSNLKQCPELGWYFNVEDYTPMISHWVKLRKEIVKRPFLATLEKFMNPFQADLSITSAFHGAYSEKMRVVGERTWFPRNIVLRRGPEGALGFSTHHTTEITLSARKSPGEFDRDVLSFSPEDLKLTPIRDSRLEKVTPEKNVELIKSYLAKGNSGDPTFDQKVKVTLAGIDHALQWMQNRGESS